MMAAYPDFTRGDPWIILAEDRLKHDAQFNQLKPISGFLMGEQAKFFFLQCGLPAHVLSQIWQLSDLNADGRMDRKEFSIAMHLIKKTLLGFELPTVLPPSLLIDHPRTTTVGATTGAMPMFGPGASTSFVPAVPMSLHGGVAGGFSGATSNFNSQHKPSAAVSGVEWCIPQAQRLKYKQLFNNTDISHKGYLTGLEAKNILSHSGLIHSILAQIWCLADIDTDGNLSPDEFCVAMYLIDLAKSGQPVPASLPPELIPPSYRRIRRPSESVSNMPLTSPVITNMTGNLPGATGSTKMDSFGDLVPSFGMGNIQPAMMQADAGMTQQEIEALKLVTFEDKRKENFEKGQAELEKRRAMLREQQQKESEARLAAERAEQEKRERIRHEQELKKQMEMEKQMEKQRQIEMEREEQRRKAMEQREAARLELDRQRQLEWERQRRDQLMSEKQREQSQVDRLRLEVGQLKLELESFESKKIEISCRTDQVRQNINEFTSSIDSMKFLRDTKLSDIELLQTDFEDWNLKLVAAQQERLRLNRHVHTPDLLADDDFKKFEHNYKLKTMAFDQLKSQLDKTESEKTGIIKQIDDSSTKLNYLKNEMNSLMSEYTKLESVLNCKKEDWQDRKVKSTSVRIIQNSSDDAFGNDFGKTSKGDGLSAIDWFSDTKQTSASSGFDAWGISSNNSMQESTALNGGDDVWAFKTDSSDVAKVSTSAASNAWASFDGADPFNSGSQSVDANQTNTGVSWAADLFPATTNEDKNKSTKSMEGFKKYLGLYTFEARNPDELSFGPGDVVLVKRDQSKAESGWMIGQRDGVEGCFPEAYVQLSTDDNTTKSDLMTKTHHHTSNSIYDVPNSKSNVHSSNGASQTTLPILRQLTTSAESSFLPFSSPSPGQIQTKTSGIEVIQVQALYPWQAKKDNHLTFKKGDIITVLDQQDIWWSGELNGKIGWFPKSYVKVTGGSDPSIAIQSDFHNNSPQLTMARPPTPTTVAPQTTPKERYIIAPTLDDRNSPAAAMPESQNGTGELNVVAMFTFTSNVPGDLTFNQGDFFPVQKTEGEWWTGTLSGKTGIFPASYVKIMDSLKLSGNKKPDIASVIAPYQATGQEQLTLQPGQLIHVRKKSPSGWWEGELQVRGQKRRVGWFPANYVKMLGQDGSTTSTPEITNRPTEPEQLKGNSTPLSLSSSSPANPPNAEKVIGLYNYKAQRDDELSFTKGAVISIISKEDQDWWKGEFNGKIGMFPANYVNPAT